MLLPKTQKQSQETRYPLWEKEIQTIRHLRQELKLLGPFPKDYPTRFLYAVNFFEIMSKLQDTGFQCIGAPLDLRPYQNALNQRLQICGRDLEGFNRTLVDEPVSLDNTFWFDLYDPSIARPASEYISSTKCYSDISRYADSPAPQPSIAGLAVSEFQVKPFVVNNRKALLQICSKLLGRSD